MHDSARIFEKQKESGVINRHRGSYAARTWLTRLIIGKSEREHDGQPKDGAYDDELRALRAVARVHEVENDECGLDRGNAEGDHDVERAEILKSGPNRETCAD